MSHERTIAVGVARQLQEHGYIGVFAGGFVRDEVLRRLFPERFTNLKSKDFDLATDATPEEVKRVFAGDSCNLVGEQFGCIKVTREGVAIDVVTLRSDGNYGDGRRPDSVAFIKGADIETLLRADASRRDLTINAMFEDPISGKLYDFFGGEEDLRRGIIRSVGSARVRIKEDRLRMIRAIRFAARFGFRIEMRLWWALKLYSRDLRPGDIVAWERIREEFRSILLGPDPVQAMRLLMKSGLMTQILPEVCRMKSWRGYQDPFWHPEGSTWIHALMALQVLVDEFPERTFELTLAVFLHDVAKPHTQTFRLERRRGRFGWLLPVRIRISNFGHAEKGAEVAGEICDRLKLSGHEKERICEIVLMHMRMHTMADPSIKRGTLVQLMGRQSITDLIAMQHCDSIGNGLPLVVRQANSHRRFYLTTLQVMRHDPVLSRRPGAKPIITGHELIRFFGLKPGPQLGFVKEATHEAQLFGEFIDEPSALEWLRNHLGRLLQESEALVAPPDSKRCLLTNRQAFSSEHA